MSYALTALRLAAIDALNAHPFLAAECDGRIYDERIADFDHREPVPVIIVTAENLNGQAWSQNNGGLPYDDACDLVLEVAMNVVGLDEDNQLALCLAASDGRLKARLDAVAYWADVALTQYNSAARRRLNTVLKRVVKRDVETFKPEQVAERLAVCRVTLRCELQGDTPLDVRNPPTGPFAGLPDPMRSFCTLVDPGSYAGIICAEQAARLPPLPLAPGSVAITLNAPAHDGAGTPAAEPSAWTQIAVGSL